MAGWRRRLLPWLRVIPLAVAALLLVAVRQPAWGDDASDAATLRAQGDALLAAGHVPDAVAMLEKAAAAAERAFGADDVRLATIFSDIALIDKSAGQYAASETYYRRAIAIFEHHAPQASATAQLYINLGSLLEQTGHYDTAEQAVRRAQAIVTAAASPDPDMLTDLLTKLGSILEAAGRPAEAEPLYRRALALKPAAANPLVTAGAAEGLAHLELDRAHFPAADTLYRRALAIRSAGQGEAAPDVAFARTNLAAVLQKEGRLREAERLYRAAAATVEKSLGPDHPALGTILNNLATVLDDSGQLAAAEPVYFRALGIRDKALGTDHPAVAAVIANLAGLYLKQHRFDDAEKLYRRALQIREARLGADHPAVAATLNSLAALLQQAGRLDAAEPLFAQALAIDEKTLGHDHPAVARVLNNMGSLALDQGRLDVAAQDLRAALAVWQATVGSAHPEYARTLNNLAFVLQAAHRDAEAEAAWRGALAVQEAAIGDHPDTANTLANLAAFEAAQGRLAAALAEVRRADAIYQAYTGRDDDRRASGAMAENAGRAPVFLRHAMIALALADATPEQRDALAAEAFLAMQRARDSGVARVMAAVGARFAAGDTPVAPLVRERQDGLDRLRALQTRRLVLLAHTGAARDGAAEAETAAAIAAQQATLRELDRRIAEKFPAFAELADPAAIAADTVQALLRPDEALVVYAVGHAELFIAAVRHDRLRVVAVPVTADSLVADVAALRSRLDPEENAELAPFPVERAYALYRTVLAPVEATLKGASHLMVVADGPLQRIPFSVLPTGIGGSASDYQAVPWLVRRQAISVLPGVSSLVALRRGGAASRADLPFLGIGAPLLGPATMASRGAIAALERGAMNTSEVRQLPSLPEAAGELRALMTAEHGSPDDLLVGAAATRTALLGRTLARYRAIAFATHGLMAGDLGSLAEPALVLTPANGDNGLLTATDIARLKLDADWIVLSACNTAAGDGSPDAEGLSGLAKAFFYAGSRALLVSHWSVISEAAARLTTATFAALAAAPAIGRAEALRRAMTGLLDHPPTPEFTHPAFWAPFVVVGEN